MLLLQRNLDSEWRDMPISNDIPDKDLPLRDDIRLLGRILGDTVRQQEGDAVYDIVEAIRQNSVRFHRDEDDAARRALEATLNGLGPEQTIPIIRAYSYFSHLANIAEAQHHIRRTRPHAMTSTPPGAGREGSMARALARAAEAGMGRLALEKFFAQAR